MVSKGIELITHHSAETNTPYDMVMVLRFDTLFKAKITALDIREGMLNLPFRSINDSPQYCTCQTADTVMIFDSRLSERVVSRCNDGHVNCHGMGKSFKDVSVHVHVWGVWLVCVCVPREE